MNSSKMNSYWKLKPIWCQPWSIILTGIILITLDFLFIKINFIRLILLLPILAWWLLFLIIAPSLDYDIDGAS